MLRPDGSPIIDVKSPIRKITLCPRFCSCRILLSTTVCPRCKSGAVGSSPSLIRRGWPLCSERASFWANSDSIKSSSTPRLVIASASRAASERASPEAPSGGSVTCAPLPFDVGLSEELFIFREKGNIGKNCQYHEFGIFSTFFWPCLGSIEAKRNCFRTKPQILTYCRSPTDNYMNVSTVSKLLFGPSRKTRILSASALFL